MLQIYLKNIKSFELKKSKCFVKFFFKSRLSLYTNLDFIKYQPNIHVTDILSNYFFYFLVFLNSCLCLFKTIWEVLTNLKLCVRLRVVKLGVRLCFFGSILMLSPRLLNVNWSASFVGDTEGRRQKLSMAASAKKRRMGCSSYTPKTSHEIFLKVVHQPLQKQGRIVHRSGKFYELKNKRNRQLTIFS